MLSLGRTLNKAAREKFRHQDIIQGQNQHVTFSQISYSSPVRFFIQTVAGFMQTQSEIKMFLGDVDKS